MATTIKSEDENKVLHKTSTSKKIAMVFSLIWLIVIVVPVGYIILNKSDAIKEFVIVKTVYEVNKTLMDEYSNISNELVNKLNINKYTQKIKLPEIKFDKLSSGVARVNKTASFLSKFGVKEASKVADQSAGLQKEVDKINAKIQKSSAEFAETLSKNINDELKKELSQMGSDQMQKQLQLNNTNYRNLAAGKYGIATEKERKITTVIYKEFAKNDTPVVKNTIDIIEEYFKYIVVGVFGLALIITLLPIFIAFTIVSFMGENLSQCPYCKKKYTH